MLTYLLLIVPILLVFGIVAAVRRQARVTRSYSMQEQEEDARVYAESTKAMEATVTEALAAKARDPRLASMSNEDLVYEVLKECYDPEIPLNVVDLGLIYEVSANSDSIDIKMSVTSPGSVPMKPFGATPTISNRSFPMRNVFPMAPGLRSKRRVQ